MKTDPDQISDIEGSPVTPIDGVGDGRYFGRIADDADERRTVPQGFYDVGTGPLA